MFLFKYCISSDIYVWNFSCKIPRTHIERTSNIALWHAVLCVSGFSCSDSRLPNEHKSMSERIGVLRESDDVRIKKYIHKVRINACNMRTDTSDSKITHHQ